MCFSCLSWYRRRLTPLLVHAGCASAAFTAMRARIVPEAKGVVAEIGFGSGLNLLHYDAAKVSRLVGVDPDTAMLALAAGRLWRVPFPVDCVEASAEDLPLAAHSADTVIVTYALCTIADPLRALGEIGRILKPSGRLIFAEHGRADPGLLARVQRRLEPAWGWLAGGCHLRREPLELIGDAGFRVVDCESRSFAGAFRLLGRHHAGIARPPRTG
jgi:SAM-dependent methyltransferase